MNNKGIFQINLDQIIRSKASGKTKNIPRFITGMLAWIIKQNDLNTFLKHNKYRTGHEMMSYAVEYFNIHLQCIGMDNIPKEGKFIFASNHPLGGMDGICLSSVIGQQYNGKIKYLVNDLLYFIPPLQPIFVPINKHGGQAKGNIQALNEAFISDNQIITFPAGLCSRKQHGKIYDTEWKKMFITKAIESHRNIIPIYFEARNSNFFYNLANIRKVLKIKFNIEMLFLPREMFKSMGSRYTIYFGKPISWQAFDSAKSHQEWAEWVKQTVYGLKIALNKD